MKTKQIYKKKYFNLLSILIVSTLISSCNSMMNDENHTDELVSTFLKISPENDENNVSINSAIRFEFASPVNPKILEEQFLLVNRNALTNQECIKIYKSLHSDIYAAIKDPMLIKHIIELHQTSGKFLWDSTYTKCEFVPFENLHPNTDYFIYIGPKMYEHMQQIMQLSDILRNWMTMTNCSCCNKKTSNGEAIVIHFKTSGLDS